MLIRYCVHALMLIYSFAIPMGPRGFGDLGRMAIYFQGAGSTGNYFRGAREQAHSFGDPCQKKQNK